MLKATKYSRVTTRINFILCFANNNILNTKKALLAIVLICIHTWVVYIYIAWVCLYVSLVLLHFDRVGLAYA